ncbi:MarR family transcriptional regulator [Nocardioides sp. zg-DK7169]|nr:MarR family transcriptional regulator [Nocardioides sp. zg-DK7169]NPC98165.1 MarR family transcriptional regulator [Nocardioides sp. zg-DK7169]
MLTRTRRLEGALDRTAYLVMARIEAEGPMSLPQLSDAFGLDVSTLNRQTAALLRAGLVERIADPDGGLARKFRLTEAGLRDLDAERTRGREGLGRVLADWSEEDVALLSSLLGRYNAAIEARDGRPWPRRGITEA